MGIVHIGASYIPAVSFSPFLDYCINIKMTCAFSGSQRLDMGELCKSVLSGMIEAEERGFPAEFWAV